MSVIALNVNTVDVPVKRQRLLDCRNMVLVHL